MPCDNWDVAEFVWCALSPLYVAVIVIEFGAPEDGVYDVVHMPDDRVHVDELNEPPEFPSLQDTVPLGVVGELDPSDTVEVNVIAFPGTKDAEFGVMATDVGCTVIIESGNVPELVWCVASPLYVAVIVIVL